MANLSDKFSTYGLSLATAQVEYLYNTDSSTSASDTTDFGYGAAGQAILAFSSSGNWVSRRVQSIVAMTPQDRITVEVSKDGNEWLDASSMFPAMESGSNKYGIDVEPVDATNLQLDVRFGGNGANGTEAWSAYTSWFWRVRITRANLSAGFGAASTTAAGLVDTSTQSFAGEKTFTNGYKGNSPFFYRFATLNNPTSETAFAAGTEVLSKTGISQSYSSGTLTITFANTGYYQIIIDGKFQAGVAQSGILLRYTVGGTSTRYFSNSAAGNNTVLLSYINAGGLGDNASGTQVFHVNVSSANQTLTINPTGLVTGSNAGNNMYCAIAINQM